MILKTAGKQTKMNSFCRAKHQQCWGICGPNKAVQHSVLRFTSEEICDSFSLIIFHSINAEKMMYLWSAPYIACCEWQWELNVNIINFLLNKIMTRSFHWNTENEPCSFRSIDLNYRRHMSHQYIAILPWKMFLHQSLTRLKLTLQILESSKTENTNFQICTSLCLGFIPGEWLDKWMVNN